MSLLLDCGADPGIANRYGDMAVDDATDDDTIHQFLLHSNKLKALTPDCTPRGSPVSDGMNNRSSTMVTSIGCLKQEASLSVIDKTKISFASQMRSSNLKRCLRYLRKQELISAALTCMHWRDAASDSRLWFVF